MKTINKLTKVMSLVAISGFALASSASAASGLESVFPQNGIFSNGGSFDFNSIVVTVFKLLLAVAVLWVVYNIVLAGIKIAGAKDDADKRKAGLKSIVNAAIGLVVSLAAFGIVTTVQKQITGNPQGGTNLGLPCTYLDGNVRKTGITKEDGTCGPSIE